jgi:hypothetical protein
MKLEFNVINKKEGDEKVNDLEKQINLINRAKISCQDRLEIYKCHSLTAIRLLQNLGFPSHYIYIASFISPFHNSFIVPLLPRQLSLNHSCLVALLAF